MSYKPLRGTSQVDHAFDVLNALGIIAFAFRGHNLILEIQVCGSSLFYILLSCSIEKIIIKILPTLLKAWFWNSQMCGVVRYMRLNYIP